MPPRPIWKFRPRSRKPPDSQEKCNRQWNNFVEDNPGGEDVLAGLNMFWKYFGDNPRAWKPAFSWKFSIAHAAAIMGLDWKMHWRAFRPRRHFISQLRTYGVELNRETGWLEIRSQLRWRHALSIARQTGRCPPTTFEARINDPDCEPEDPVPPHLLPRKKGYYRYPGKLSTNAEPANIEKEMWRIGHGDKTYDERRRRYFNGEDRFRGGAVNEQNGTQERFSSAARRVIERLAR